MWILNMTRIVLLGLVLSACGSKGGDDTGNDNSESSLSSDGAGEVTVTDVAPFGDVVSAIWQNTPDTLGLWSMDKESGIASLVSDDARIDQLSIHTYAYTCEKAQDYWREIGAASAAVLAAMGSGTVTDACDEMTTLLSVTETYSAHIPNTWNTLYVSIDDFEETGPTSGEYDVDDGGSGLTYHFDCASEYEWDADSCAFVATGADCLSSMSWSIEDFSFTIFSVEDTVVGSLVGSLTDRISDEAEGTIDASFEAKLCDVDLPDSFLIF
jgi:hypothetical protein